jgi:hypothetical protein
MRRGGIQFRTAIPNRERQGLRKIRVRTRLAGESACTTLTNKDLRLGGAGAFTCEPIFSQARKRPVAYIFVRFLSLAGR